MLEVHSKRPEPPWELVPLAGVFPFSAYSKAFATYFKTLLKTLSEELVLPVLLIVVSLTIHLSNMVDPIWGNLLPVKSVES